MKCKHIAMNVLLALSVSCIPFSAVSCSDGKTGSRTASATGGFVSADIGEAVPFDAEGMHFSAKSGFYKQGFSLTISADDGADIYYTLDGSIPTADSTKYTAPIEIKDASAEENRLSAHKDIAQPIAAADDFVPKSAVDKATVVRAVAIGRNGRQSPVVSNTYFVGFDDKADYYKKYKVVSLMTDEENLFDYEKGIYVTGKTYDDWKNSSEYDPSAYEWTIPGNYSQRGREWEREAEIQFFEGGQPVISQNVGIRIHGGATRSYSQKSFNVYARSDYGAPKLEYDLFPGNVKNAIDDSPVTVFDSFTLRNGGNDAYYTRFSDKLIQSLVSDRQFLTQGMEPCIVFIDGEFWGHYEITEKMDADFISAHCGIPAKDICIIKKEALDDGSEETFAEWEKLRKWIQDTDFSVQANYDELCGCVDMQGFMDYISTEIYINNHDWGKPNAAFWKAETNGGSSPYADGKWRFILFDTEYSSGLYGEASPYEDSFERLMKSDCFLADLFNGALENEGFRRQFGETFTDIADNNFNTEKVTAEIDRLAEEYRGMTVATYDRFWSGWTGGSAAEMNYDTAVDSLRSFYKQRYEFITKDLDAILG
ncbi:MAG: CotH kinase family protein [Ruminococcus sp.]|uniref:CotH kinase family protein n=1 Tax=Ruminococcus sp. TaxID=41978 RepID=UPI0025FE595E|nr:CotH kinase family protein [Ruminococcus sp.]MBR6996704.1 CotH kinase family protein [Ruminococcus sp.]